MRPVGGRRRGAARRPSASRARRPLRRAEGGHLIVVLMVGVTVLMIMLTAAAQSWTFQMRREMELELIFRGEQYVKALEAFRRMNGGGFPLGDLKILAQKNATGVRYIRKLYKNPLDPNGRWQYLYLHPGGSGFINPCASGAAAQAYSPFGMPGTSSVQGGLMGQGSMGRGYRRTIRSETPAAQTPASALSAMDPNLFRETGMAKLNLPIVGVVNCDVRESIRIYKGQTWINNWAFTPLAQGEFAGNVQPGGTRGAPLPMTGLGLSGSEFYPKGSGGGLGPNRDRPRTVQEFIDQPPPEPPPPPPPPPEEEEDEDDEGDDEEDDEDAEDEGEDEPPDPNSPQDPNAP